MKDVESRLLSLCQNKKILFLEGDCSLNNSIGNFENWCIDNKIKYNVLYNIRQLPLSYIMDQIAGYDIIAFETTWTYKIAHDIQDALIKSPYNLKIIECFIGKPSWYRKPKKVKHDLYTLFSFEENVSDWKLNKLKR